MNLSPALLCPLLTLLLPIQAATLTWDGGGDATTFSDPLNWDTDTIPTVTDDVIINDPADPTITITGDTTIQSLSCSENLSITAGTLKVTAGASTITATLQVGFGTALEVDGATATLIASGPSTADNSSLIVRNGGQLTLSLLASYDSTSNADRFLFAEGPGGLLSPPGSYHPQRLHRPLR